MILDYVNQKQVNGVTYTAYRDDATPILTYISNGNTPVQADLNAVWNDDAALEALFAGNNS
ncbi:MAG TPA: hypothetical protein VN736_01140 [Candidatus Limnocylindrales bacterium]|nr:hypothetical protein [Candidatus Limnocylindrales bacterium]